MEFKLTSKLDTGLEGVVAEKELDIFTMLGVLVI